MVEGLSETTQFRQKFIITEGVRVIASSSVLANFNTDNSQIASFSEAILVDLIKQKCQLLFKARLNIINVGYVQGNTE